MATTRNPRHGSMQFWHRRKAARPYPRIRHQDSSGHKVAGFAGYKVGMTHLMITDNKPSSITKGEEIFCPVTVIECPPIRIASIRFYKKNNSGLRVATEIILKGDKELARKLSLPKKETLGRLEQVKLEDYLDIRLLVYTQPRLSGVGKKKPEVFELALGGSISEKLAFAKENMGREIKLEDVFKEGQQIDVFAVTKGKGLQGPIKRFGVTRRGHKSEKGVRRVGNLGSWTGNRSWTVARAGQMGYHNRVVMNKLVIKISNVASEINPKGGFLHYGLVRGTYMLLKGSIQGPSKRLVRLIPSKRPDHRIPEAAPAIEFTSLESKQGL